MSVAARSFREGLTAINRRDWAKYRSLLAPNFHFTDYAAEVSTQTADEFIVLMQESVAPFSDEQVTVRCLTSTETTVVAELVAEGTHTGPLPLPMGGEIAATFKEFTQHFCVVCEYDDKGVGLACRAYANPLAILGQLGVLTGSPSSGALPRPRQVVIGEPTRR